MKSKVLAEKSSSTAKKRVEKPEVQPVYKEFARLAEEHTLIPVWRRLRADLETPVSAFLKIVGGAAAEEAEAFMLESVEGGERVGRYTFIGVRPYKRIVVRGRQIKITEGRKTTYSEGDVFELLKQALGGHRPARIAGLPPFTAGAVGYFAYDVVRQIEKLPELAADELGVPDACLMFFDMVLAFDHVKKEILLVATADVTKRRPKDAYADAQKRLRSVERRLSRPLPKQKRVAAKGKLKIKFRTKKADFLSAVEKIKEYIAAGDVFQAVISQRFDVEPEAEPFSIYRALRTVNPSPYMYFLKMAGEPGSREGKAGKEKAEPMYVVGSSPELLVRVHGRKVEYRPIAGTRPRSEDEVEDRRIGEELRHDEKELAEHVMLVDLGRNDVGRVSEFGSVKVKDLMVIERYSHVMHLVSSVEGGLRPELGAMDALKACFPAGTLSGAPKIRAMEIIEELEPARRGVYGGAVLYADFSGNLDSCIVIRTLVLNGRKGSVQAGAGIVADSIAESEYQESINKAQAVMRAIGLAD